MSRQVAGDTEGAPMRAFAAMSQRDARIMAAAEGIAFSRKPVIALRNGRFGSGAMDSPTTKGCDQADSAEQAAREKGAIFRRYKELDL